MIATHQDSTQAPMGRRKLLGLLAGGSIAGAAMLAMPRSAAAMEAASLEPHGDGQGMEVGGSYKFPPLWGPHSYNFGAGMAKLKMASAFIKANMPLNNPGSLTEQQAWDVAAYVDGHKRPPDPRKLSEK